MTSAMNMASSRATDSSKQSPVAVLVVGASGHGKSHFVDRLVGNCVTEASDSVFAWTIKTRGFPTSIDDKAVFICDTPGFGDAFSEDLENFEDVLKALYSQYMVQLKVQAVLFLYDITKEWGSVSRRTLEIVENLCGEDALANVLVVTTHWDVCEPSMAERREKELLESAFRPAFGSEVTLVRYDGSSDRALEITRQHMSWETVTLVIQKELAEGCLLKDTRASKVVAKEAEYIIKREAKEEQTNLEASDTATNADMDIASVGESAFADIGCAVGAVLLFIVGLGLGLACGGQDSVSQRAEAEASLRVSYAGRRAGSQHRK